MPNTAQTVTFSEQAGTSPVGVPADTSCRTTSLTELLASMPDRRDVVIGVLDFCRDAKPLEEAARKADELQADNRSAFSGMALCRLLERHGALERVASDNEPHPSEATGQQFEDDAAMSAGNGRASWRTTDAAAAFVDSDDPAARMFALFSDEPEFAHIYRFILEKASEPDGVKTKELSSVVDRDPAVQSPRRYTGRFTDRLARCGALVWTDHAWHTTELGIEGIGALA